MTTSTPAQARASFAEIDRKYIIHIQHNPKRLRPHSARLTHGIMHVQGINGAGSWHARTRDRLIAKCERWIMRNAQKHGITDPSITVQERNP
jgi:hypothetical protein